MFAHPVIVFLTDLKWKQFAKKDFTVLVVINILNTACTTSFMLLGAQHPLLSFALAVAQLMLCLIRMYFYLVSCYRQIRSGTGATYNLLRKSFTIPYAMHDAFLWINVTTAVFSLALFAETFDSDVFSWKTELQGKHKVGGNAACGVIQPYHPLSA